MRHKRFTLVADRSRVSLLVETNTGFKMNLSLVNCSLTGVGAIYDNLMPENEGLEVGSILPAAKLICEGSEITLGRLVLRRLDAREKETHLGFSTMDTRIPVDGVLSRYIAQDMESRPNPYSYELGPEKFSLINFKDVSQPNVDLFQRTRKFQIFYEDFTKRYQLGSVRTASKGERIKLTKKRKAGRNDYLVMASNDYLGLACHPEVMSAAKKAIDDYGFGATGSPLTTGLSDLHEELSEILATMLHKEKVMIFNSGYAANLGLITGLTTAQDLIVADLLCHASIQDALTTSNATTRFFKHNDPAHLKKVLKDQRESHGGALVVTEGVFSMDGDVPPLKKISDMAREFGARLMVDEAHSFGVVGPHGLGAWEKYPDAKVDIIMGTFSKVCGGIGGFVAATEEVINWLNWFARSYMFSVAIPPSTAAAAIAALQIFQSEPQRVEKLHANIRYFVTGLIELGLKMNPAHESPVIPMIIGDEAKIATMNNIYREAGIFVTPIGYPAVPRKRERFRFTMMATHSTSDLDYVLSVTEKALRVAGVPLHVEDEEDESTELKIAK